MHEKYCNKKFTNYSQHPSTDTVDDIGIAAESRVKAVFEANRIRQARLLQHGATYTTKHGYSDESQYGSLSSTRNSADLGALEKKEEKEEEVLGILDEAFGDEKSGEEGWSNSLESQKVQP